MTTTGTKTAKLAALLKRTAQKLVKDPKKAQKQLKKLALTLPLMALLVEEVRAAQNKVNIDANAIVGEVFPNEQELAEFISEQNLDEGQYTELEEELEGIILAKNDAGEEDDDKGAYIQKTDGGVGAEKAFGSDAAGGSLAPEAGAEHAAAATESFELAGLFIPVPPAAFAAGITTAGAVVTEFFAGTTATDIPAVVDTPTVVDASGTNLTTSLKDLQKLGVDFVNPAAGENTITLALGATDALAGTAGIPLFGDTNKDGVLSTAEDEALSVTLTVDSLAQFNELASLPGLGALGIDNVQLNLADQQSLNTLLADANLATNLATVRNDGLLASTIDMATASVVNISQAQASALLEDGLHFASNDSITLDASSTHLNTSLKDLQKLGVDNVATTLSHVDIDLGEAGTLSSAGIPSFASGVDVTLNVANATGLGEAMVSTQALHAAGIDHIDLASNAGAITQAQANSMVANGIDFAADDSITLNVTDISQTISSLSSFQTLGVGQLDMVASSASISMAQADTLLAAGIGFVASDDITLNAEGTHLHTSLKDLQKLGVDHVSLAADQTSVDIDMGGALSANGIPSFASGVDVTLNANSLDDVLGLAQQLHTAGIDHIKLADQNVNLTSAQAQTLINAGLDIAPSSTVSLNVADADLQSTLANLQNIQTLGVDQIDLASNAASISLSQANDLVAKELHFANNDAVTVNVADAAGLTQALSNTAAYKAAGIDHIDLSTNAGAITQAQADDMAAKGLDFVANDSITVNVADAAGLTQALSNTAAYKAAGIDHIDLSTNAGAITQAQADDMAAKGLDFVANDSITVNVADATGLTQALASTAAFHAAGIDHIDLATNTGSISQTQANSMVTNGLDFAANDDITVNVADATGLTQAFNNSAAFHTAGIDHIDMTNNVANITQAQFNDLAINGLNFVSADDVTMTVHGTHLGTSLSDLQAHGVDHVVMGLDNSSDFTYALNHAQDLVDHGVDQIDLLTDSGTINYAGASYLADAGITFEANDDVTLVIQEGPSGSADFVSAMQNAADLQTVGIDHIDMAADIGWLNAAGADKLITAGIDFAANDDITLISNGAYVANHVSDLKALGVDHIALSAGADFDVLNSAATALSEAGLGHIDVYADQFAALTSFDTLKNIHSKGVDFNVHYSDSADFAGFNKLIDLYNATDLTQDLATVLKDAGISHINIDEGNTAVYWTDRVATALHDAGILTAASAATVVVDVLNSPVLTTTAKAMAELGVDGIDAEADPANTTTTLNKVFVGLGTENMQEVQSILDSFADYDLFNEGTDGALVIEQSVSEAFNNLSVAESSALLSRLSELGFNEVDVINDAGTQVETFNIVAQTTNGTPTVQLIGVPDAHSAELDADILDKIHKA